MKHHIPKSSAFLPLDKEEEDLMEIEKHLSDTFPKRLTSAEYNKFKKKLETAAKNSVTARKMISIKIRESDLDSLKAEASKRGLPYQSLINSILHQYVNGHLKSA